MRFLCFVIGLVILASLVPEVFSALVAVLEKLLILADKLLATVLATMPG